MMRRGLEPDKIRDACALQREADAHYHALMDAKRFWKA